MNGKTEPGSEHIDSAIASENSPANTLAIAPAIALEKISGLTYNGTELSLVVNSHGCTKAEDFIVEYQTKNNICLVTVQRIKPDHCRKAPHAVRINIAWEKPKACGNTALVIANPLLEFQSSPANR